MSVSPTTSANQQQTQNRRRAAVLPTTTATKNNNKRQLLTGHAYKTRRSTTKLYSDNSAAAYREETTNDKNDDADTDNDADDITKDDDIYLSLRQQVGNANNPPGGASYNGLSAENVERVRLLVRHYAERRKSSRVALFEQPMSDSSSSSSSHEISTMTSERDDDAARKQEVFRKRLAQIFGHERLSSNDEKASKRAAQRHNLHEHKKVELCGITFSIPGWMMSMVPHTILPQSYRYIMWLAIITCAFLYNAFAIPLRTLYDVETDQTVPYWLVADYFCDGIYLIDMLGVRPLLMFVHHGIYVESRRETALHYMSSQLFLIDLLALLPLDLLYFSIGHVVPALRLLRMLKVHCYWEFFDRVETIASIPNVLRIFKTIMYMLYLVHINSGLYYSISYYERTMFNNTNEWVFVGADQRHAYIRCSYQALKMAIKIGHNPIPFNSRQRAFHTFSLLMGIFVFAILVGQIRDIYTSISAREAEFRRKLDLTIRYLQKLKLPHATIEKVRAWFIYNWKFQKTLDENDYLEILPRKLKTDLAINVHYNTIAKVTLFQDVEQGLISELVLMLRPRLYLPGEYVCRRGEVGKEMFIIKYGLVDVVGGPNDTTVLATLGEGTVIGEIALLSLGGDNRRTAHVRSKGISQLFVLSKHDLEMALQDYPTAQDILKKKARAIIRQNEKKRRTQAAGAAATSADGPQHQPTENVKKKISVINPQMDQAHHARIDDNRATDANGIRHSKWYGGSEYGISSMFARLLPNAEAIRQRLGIRRAMHTIMTESMSTPMLATIPNDHHHHYQNVTTATETRAAAVGSRSNVVQRRMMRHKTIVRPSVLKAMRYASSSTPSLARPSTSANEPSFCCEAQTLAILGGGEVAEKPTLATSGAVDDSRLDPRRYGDDRLAGVAGETVGLAENAAFLPQPASSSRTQQIVHRELDPVDAREQFRPLLPEREEGASSSEDSFVQMVTVV